MSLARDPIIGCALKKEASQLRNWLANACPIIVTGLGPDRTLDSLEEFFRQHKPSLFLFAGTAGQLDPELRLGDCVCPQVWRLESGTSFSVDPRTVETLRKKGWKVEGTGLTVPTPVVRRNTRIELNRKTGACVVDMESASAMMVASSFQVPCLSVKVISDTADSGMLAFYRHFEANMATLADRLRALLETLRK